MRLPPGRARAFLRQENRAVIAWRGAASAGLVSSADRAYMKAPVPRPTPDFGTKCPELVDTLTKKQTDFPLKIEMGGKHFRVNPKFCVTAKLWCKIEQKCFKAGAAQAAAAFSTKITALRGDVKGKGASPPFILTLDMPVCSRLFVSVKPPRV